MRVRNRCLDTLKKDNQIVHNSFPFDQESIIQDEEVEGRSMICNLGWRGSRNGYYLSYVFEENVGPKINDFGTRSGQENYYQYNLEYSLVTR